MANNFKGNPIVLDTFSSAINLNESLGFKAGTPLFVQSIEWVAPTTADHTCTITSDIGNNVFNETCVTGKQSIIKYYAGVPIQNLKIAVAAGAHMASGALHILLR